MSNRIKRLVNIIAIVLIIAICIFIAIFLDIHNPDDSQLLIYLIIILVNPILIPLIGKEYRRFRYNESKYITDKFTSVQQEELQSMEDEEITMERIVSWELPSVDNNIYESEPVSLSYILTMLKSMEYTNIRIDGDYIFFKEEDCEYRLYSVWIPTRQVNLMVMDFFCYNAENAELDYLYDLAGGLTHDRVMTKVRLLNNADNSASYQVLISCDTILMRKSDLRLMILSLINYICSTKEDFYQHRKQFFILKDSCDDNDIERHKSLHKTKYEC